MENLMPIKNINGIAIFNWFYSGAQEVILNKKYLNSINVFPIADGDTGTNLVTTLKAMVDKPKRKNNFSEMMSGISESGLAYSRGNSGIIFASYVNGLAIEGKSYEEVGIREFSHIAHKAVDYLYQAIDNPVEGTMISVIRDWAVFLFRNNENYESIQELLIDAYQTANDSLEQTKSTLEILRVNHVVDSGAAGFVCFLKGINRFFTGGEVEEDFTEEVDLKIVILDEITANFQFCTEVFLELSTQIQDSAINELINTIKSRMSRYGDSLIVSSHSRKMRIHIHTDTPELVVESLKEYGTLLEQKVDNMKLQNSVIMNKKNTIGILTDSIADIPEHFKLQNQIHTLPLGIIIDGTVYLDKLTIQLKQLFKSLNECEVYPTSSQAEPRRIKLFLENLLETYDSLIFIAVSSKLSGTFDAINKVAKEMDKKGKRITIIDSRLNSGAEGLIVKAASDFLNRGFTHDDIIREIEALIPKTKIYVCLNTIEYAVRSGRVHSTVGKLGMLLKLRPIMTLDQEGNGATFGMGFSKKGIERKIIKLIRKAMDAGGIKVYSIVHADNIELAMEFKNQLTQIIGKEPEFITDISSIIAIHSGLGTVAVCLTEN